MNETIAFCFDCMTRVKKEEIKGIKGDKDYIYLDCNCYSFEKIRHVGEIPTPLYNIIQQYKVSNS